MMPLSMMNEYTRERVAEQHEDGSQVGGSRARCAGKSFEGQGLKFITCAVESGLGSGARSCAYGRPGRTNVSTGAGADPRT
jgi:hypothetical protein